MRAKMPSLVTSSSALRPLGTNTVGRTSLSLASPPIPYISRLSLVTFRRPLMMAPPPLRQSPPKAAAFRHTDEALTFSMTHVMLLMMTAPLGVHRVTVLQMGHEGPEAAAVARKARLILPTLNAAIPMGTPVPGAKWRAD